MKGPTWMQFSAQGREMKLQQLVRVKREGRDKAVRSHLVKNEKTKRSCNIKLVHSTNPKSIDL